MNANKEIKLLLKRHDFSVENFEDKLIVDFKEPVTIKTLINQRTAENNYIISRLDVDVKLPNGQVIIESFGDAGDSKEDAKFRNIQNFALNSLHVITACLNDKKDDEQIFYDEWEIGENKWKAFIGNYNFKSGVNGEIKLPENLFTSIEKKIREKIDQNMDYCWVRFFFAQHNQKINAVEILLNNESLEQEQVELSNLDWELKDEYYSVRNFMMLKKN